MWQRLMTSSPLSYSTNSPAGGKRCTHKMCQLTRILLAITVISGVCVCTDECGDGSGKSLPNVSNSERPYFDQHSPTNITVQLGSRAHIGCIVHQRGDAAVSWVRRRDSHIIAVGHYTFIGDDRFRSLYWADSDTWTLQIGRVRHEDGGQYECQVSSEPKMCHLIALTVIVPQVRILTDRDGDVFVNHNSQVQLECVIAGTIEPPAFVFWFHNQRRLTSSENEAGAAVAATAVASAASGAAGAAMARSHQRVNIATQRSSADLTRSVLTVSGVTLADSGNYTCQPSSLPADSTTLHVLNGEHRAAMQDGVSGGFPTGTTRRLWLMCTLLLLLLPTVALPNVVTPV